MESGYLRADVLPGHPQFGKPIKCTDPFHTPARLNRMARVSQLGPEDVKRRLSDIRPDVKNKPMLDAATDILKRGYGWLYIYGGPGNAKSEVLKAIVNEMNDTGRGPAMYTTMGSIIDFIKAGFTSPDSWRFETIKQYRVLAVDEMDKIRVTDWTEEFRFKFLDDRYMSAINKTTMTIFAGNPNPQVIYDDVLYDRFRDGRFAIVENRAPSARQYMDWTMEAR